jgi:HEAT repeat protein
MQWWTAQQLKSKNPDARQEAVIKLAGEGSAQAYRAIATLAGDPEALVRLAVMRALGNWKEPASLKALFKALQDPVDTVREAAVMSLRKIGDITTIQHLLPLLQDSHTGVRWHAAKTLERFGWQPRSDHERMLRDFALGDYVGAAQAGLPALEVLTKSLNSENTSFTQRRAVAEALGELGSDKVVGPLVIALKDAEPSVRVAAIEALAQVRDSRTIEALKACLADTDANVRAAAVSALGAFGGGSVVPVIIEAAKDPHWSVRKASVVALGNLKSASGVSAAIPMLKDPDHDVREATCAALAKLRDRQAITALVVALADSQSPVRHAAACALRDIDPEWERSSEAQRAVPELQTAFRDREYWVRHAARDTLQRIENAAVNGTPGFEPLDERLNAAVDVLVLALKHSERDLRQAAAEALGRLGNPQVANLLMPAIHDHDQWVRESVTKALKQVGTAAASAQPIGQAA